MKQTNERKQKIMMKSEFAALAEIDIDEIDNFDYEVIEYVYMYHPSINNKKDIVNIWKLNGGMRIIRDMVETAKESERIQNDIIKYQSLLNESKKAFENLKSGKRM